MSPLPVDELNLKPPAAVSVTSGRETECPAFDFPDNDTLAALHERALVLGGRYPVSMANVLVGRMPSFPYVCVYANDLLEVLDSDYEVIPLVPRFRVPMVVTRKPSFAPLDWEYD